MAYRVGTDGFVINKQWKYSSCVTKSAISEFDGRSASIFRKSTGCCINP